MQVTETRSDGLKRAYTVVLPAADIESRRMARLTDLGKTLRLPGFRPGKVPLPVVKQRFGAAVSAEVMEQSVTEAAQQVMSERGLRPAEQPRIDLVTGDPAQAGTVDLEFKVELEVLPEILLPDFSTIALTRRRAEVAPETVDEALKTVAERNRDLEEISPEELGDRRAARGEFLTIDYVGKIDGTAFPGGTGTDIDVEVGGGGFIPGFAEQIEGMKPGEVRTIDVTFPEGYGEKELAGKPATFEITAKRLRKSNVPVADDALATRIGFDSLDELRDLLTRQRQREYDQMSRMLIKRQLLDVLADRASFTAPETMVEREFAQIWQRIEADRSAGKLDEDDKSKDDDTLKAEYRAIADRRVRLGLLLAEIGRVNAIIVSPEELNRAMRAEAARYPGQEAQMMELFRKYPAAVDSLRGPILEDKVIDFIVELAQVSDETVAPEQLALDAAAQPSVPPATEAAQSDVAPPEAAHSDVTQANVTQADVTQPDVTQSDVTQSEVPQSEAPSSTDGTVQTAEGRSADAAAVEGSDNRPPDPAPEPVA